MTSHAHAQCVADIPRVWAERAPERAALVSGSTVLSFAALDAGSNRVAQALIAAGLKPGARVAILAKDSLDVYEAYFGCAKAGAVALGVNWRLTPREIAFILDDSGAELIFVGAEFAERVRSLLSASAHAPSCVVFGTHDDDSSSQRYTSWRDAAPCSDPALSARPDDVVVQMYTSGTTGHPKGVMLANRSFFAVVASMRAAGDAWIGFGPDDVSLMPIPSFHIGGLWWAMTGLNAGATNVIMPSFVGAELLRLVAAHRVTKICMVPAMMQVALLEPDAERTDFASLDTIVYGGSPIPRALMEHALATFGCRFAQIYGLTETGNTAVCLRPDDHLDLDSERLKAAGRAYPGVRLKCLGPDGAELPPRAIGEICIASPANMVGYWKRDDATAETLRDGWVHTGDAGFLDEHGYLYVQDRVKDMIIYAGENVYPAEIESVLCGHPDVLEAAVIGVPDERWGEQVKAIVVRRQGAALTGRALLAHARGELAEFKLPKSVDFVDALPRTVSGKIKKPELRAPYWDGRERQVN
ncbi:MAG: acyl-CoA synthetase [Planctomycetota bacterium]|nr:MAG: acyl-CoA synthetase [Planctomycetota bacterium]